MGVWKCPWLGIQTQLSWISCWDITGCAGCWSCHSVQRLYGTRSAFLTGRVVCLGGIPDVLPMWLCVLVAQHGTTCCAIHHMVSSGLVCERD